jgi:hypothetical protein
VNAREERQILVALLAMLEAPERASELGAHLRADAAPQLDGVLAVARHHRLTALLSATCGNQLPAPFAEACRRDRTVAAAHGRVLGDAAERCLRALGARGMRPVLLKGLAYERFLYRLPGCRPMADVDLLVRGEERREACLVLADLGFEPRAAAAGFDEPDYHEIGWGQGGVSIDLHLGLAPRARCAIDYATLWAGVREEAFGEARAFLLAPAHAAVFHALHMAIDHFAVPALFVVDFGRLLPAPEDTGAARAVAEAWRCERAFATALALAESLLPRWAAAQRLAPPTARGMRIAGRFGATRPLPRAEQLRRKVAHIDGAGMAARYLAVQARRKLRELVEQHVRRRSPRARLGLPSRKE